MHVVLFAHSVGLALAQSGVARGAGPSLISYSEGMLACRELVQNLVSPESLVGFRRNNSA